MRNKMEFLFVELRTILEIPIPMFVKGCGRNRCRAIFLFFFAVNDKMWFVNLRICWIACS